MTRKEDMDLTAEDFWHSKHQKYAELDFVKKPNWLARTFVENAESPQDVLDIGCGQGQDSVYFAAMGHRVVAADFSQFALDQFKDAADAVSIRQLVLDIGTPPYPFDDAAFDVVYAHLSLHYFPEGVTREIFAELARILRPGGHLWALFNSDHDPELTTARPDQILEPAFVRVSQGDDKRFFHPHELPDLLGPQFAVELSRYGTGTTKNNDDAFVELVARKEFVQ